MSGVSQAYINNDANGPSEEDDIQGERDDIVEAISAAGGVLAGEIGDEGADSDEESEQGARGDAQSAAVEPVREVSPIAANIAWLGYTSLLRMVETGMLDSEYPAPGFTDKVKNCSQTKEYFDGCLARHLPKYFCNAGPVEGLVVCTTYHYATAASEEKERRLGMKSTREQAQVEEVLPPSKKPVIEIPSVVDPVVY